MRGNDGGILHCGNYILFASDVIVLFIYSQIGISILMNENIWGIIKQKEKQKLVMCKFLIKNTNKYSKGIKNCEFGYVK